MFYEARVISISFSPPGAIFSDRAYRFRR
jgi:hypothetical protein